MFPFNLDQLGALEREVDHHDLDVEHKSDNRISPSLTCFSASSCKIPYFFVDLTNENVAFTGDLIEFLIGQFTPLRLHLTPDLLPGTLDLIPVHLFLLWVFDGHFGVP
jgi:hypothetical protein